MSRRVALFVLLAAGTASAQAAPVPPPEVAEAQLRAINHRFVNTFATGDRAYMDALTAEDFLLIGNSGDWLDRGRHLELMSKATVPAVSYDDLRVRLFGNVALLHGFFEATGDQGVLARVRYTDVYHWDGDAWRLVHAQNTPLRAGAAKLQRRGELPPIAPWQGRDPQGEDLEVLRQLNESYVDAYRRADVGWYDAHLAPDYVVVNGDGTFDDRARALQAFAEPSYAQHMKSFPVDHVRIRRFGDVALIHAENAYELKDGRKGISRYTDIWQKEPGGSWRCLAAHITVHKAPG